MQSFCSSTIHISENIKNEFILRLAGQFSLQYRMILCIFLNTEEITIVYTWHLFGQTIFGVMKWSTLSRDKKNYYLDQHDSTSYLL